MTETKQKSGVVQKLMQLAGVVREPRTIPSHLMQAFIRIWRTKGGSWYGIGYLLTFVYLEVRMLAEDFTEADGFFDFLINQIPELLFRWFTESIMNMVTAFMWPYKLIELLGVAIGVMILIGIHYAFELLLRPAAESRFPELKADRERKAAKKKEKEAYKQETKAHKHAQKKATKRSS
ncbi:MAG: hypothetical protein AAF541_14010 [Pseudomonadota bacterium]